MSVLEKLHSLGDRVADRVSPVLVKEVRQSLRGRYFTLLFFLTLTVATLVAGAFLSFQSDGNPSEDAGVEFFTAMYACLSAAVHVFVPFAAYLSLGAERDENTFDLLVLSNLGPRQILWGKVLSSGVQLLLYYCAFGPFLAFAFLLPGLDLWAAGLALLLTLLSSLGLSILGLFAASLHKNRLVRSFLMALLAVVLVPCAFATTNMAWGMVYRPQFLQESEAWLVVAGLAALVLYVAAVLFTLACTRLAHPEENRSTGLRILITIGLLIAALTAHLIYQEVGDTDVILALGTFMVVGLSVLSITSVAEEEALGRRVRLHVPKSRVLEVLGFVYLPGGGRGFLLFLFHMALVLTFAFSELSGAGFDVLDWTANGFASSGGAERAALWVFCFALYMIVYVGLPSALFSPWSGTPNVRVAARISIPLLFFLGLLLPTFFGYLFDIDGLRDTEHLGSPVWIPDDLEDAPIWALGFVFAAVALVLLANTPRMLRGLREVAAACAQRRARASSEANGDSA